MPICSDQEATQDAEFEDDFEQEVNPSNKDYQSKLLEATKWSSYTKHLLSKTTEHLTEITDQLADVKSQLLTVNSQLAEIKQLLADAKYSSRCKRNPQYCTPDA